MTEKRCDSYVMSSLLYPPRVDFDKIKNLFIFIVFSWKIHKNFLLDISVGNLVTLLLLSIILYHGRYIFTQLRHLYCRK